jgi:aryl-alcohol dehydrogenase-like predicted oxidoreductase
MTRRQFVQCAGVGLAASMLPWSKLSAATTGATGEFRRGGMVYRPLGKTGMNVSLLAFGAHKERAGPSEQWQEGSPLQERRDRRISKAIDLGINLFDVYGDQFAPFAKLVKPKRDKVLIASLLHNRTFVGQEAIDRVAKSFGGYIDLYRIRCETVDFDYDLLEQWDVLRRAKEAGKIRAIGIVCHLEGPMMTALKELEGLDYLMLPYNFIHSKAGYAEFLPAAAKRDIGLIGIKPLAAGSIVRLDPRSKSGANPDNSDFMRFSPSPGSGEILPAAVAELTKALNQLPDETLPQAAMRYVYSRPFLSATVAGMFEDQFLTDNHAALSRYHDQLTREEHTTFDAARKLTSVAGTGWLPENYQWLEEQWRA